jgi:glucosamine--fructose-6-phosphate aminotransferase (isomerizing)
VLLQPDVLSIFIAPYGNYNQKIHDSVQMAKTVNSESLVVVPEGETTLSSLADHVITIPGALEEIYFPIISIVVFQLLGYHLGIERNFNPDTLRTDDIQYAKAWLKAFPLGSH